MKDKALARLVYDTKKTAEHFIPIFLLKIFRSKIHGNEVIQSKKLFPIR